jgi:hypothetical protein
VAAAGCEPISALDPPTLPSPLVTTAGVSWAFPEAQSFGFVLSCPAVLRGGDLHDPCFAGEKAKAAQSESDGFDPGHREGWAQTRHA